jgi:hypothetical protein
MNRFSLSTLKTLLVQFHSVFFYSTTTNYYDEIALPSLEMRAHWSMENGAKNFSARKFQRRKNSNLCLSWWSQNCVNVERVCDNESLTYSLSSPNSLMYYASDESKSYQRRFYLNYQHLFGREREERRQIRHSWINWSLTRNTGKTAVRDKIHLSHGTLNYFRENQTPWPKRRPLIFMFSTFLAIYSINTN